MRVFRWVKHNPLITLDIVKAVLLMVLAIAFINFNMRLSDLTKSTNHLSSNQEKTISTLSDSFNGLQRHMDCIVALFHQPNRQSLVITDIENCQIDANGNVSGSSPPKAAQATAPTPKSQPKSPTSPSSSSPSSPPQSHRPSQPPSLIRQVTNFLGI